MDDKSRLVDAAALITVSAAALYLLGYTYHASYLAVFGLTPSFFHRDAADYIVTAWETVMWLWLAVAVFAFFRAFLRDISPSGLKTWFEKSVPKAILSLGWFGAALAFVLAGVHMESRGRSDAIAHANSRKTVKVVSAGDDLKLPDNLCFLHYSDGKYVFYYLPSPDSKPTVVIVRGEDIRRIDYPQM